MGAGNAKQFTWLEVQSHNYIVAHRRVYEPRRLTLPSWHPPIPRATDVTRDYDFHHPAARRLWQAALIGQLR